MKNWKEYKSIYKSKEEKAYINYADRHIKELIDDIGYIYSKKKIKKIPITEITYKIANTKKILQKLIDYELEVAKATRSKVNKQHQNAINKIFSIAIAVTVIAFIIFIPLLKNIEQNQTRLQMLTQKLKNISIKDPMTKLYNRRYFDHISKKSLLNAARYDKSITFMMMDIDFFKQYNDTYGHQAGDETIKSVANVLENSVKRANDYAFRLGGEEFGVLLYDASKEYSVKIANKIKENVQDQKIAHEKNSASPYVTISIGVIIQTIDKHTLDESTMEKMVEEADQKLYNSKQQGRNKVTL
jgi:diguanylate cyclase (GGDEF)-like protein